MPKIPYAPYQGQIDANAPAIQASPDAFAAPGQALARGGQALQHTALDILTVQRALSAEQAKLDVDDKISQAKVNYASGLADMRASGVLGKDYAQRANELYGHITHQQESTLLYPDSVGLWRRKSKLLGNQLQVDAIHEGVKIQHGEILVTADAEQKRDLNTAVFGPDGEWQKAATRIKDRPASLFDRGVIGPDAYRAMVNQTNREMQLGIIAKEIENPATREQIHKLLEVGAFPYLQPDEQLKLSDGYRRREVDREEKAETRLQKKAEEDRKNYVADLEVRIDAAKTGGGDLAAIRREIYQGVELRRLKREDVTHALTMLDREAAGTDDPATFLAMAPDIHGTSPRFTERDVRAAMTAGRLTPKTGIALIDRLRQDVQRKEDKAHQQDVEDYARATNQIRLSLGFASQFDPGTSDEARRLLFQATVAFDNLNRRTNPNAKLGPWDALPIVLPRYQGIQTRDAQMSLDNLAKSADKRFFPYPTPPEVTDAKAWEEWSIRTRQAIEAQPEKDTNPRIWEEQLRRLDSILSQAETTRKSKQRQQETPRYGPARKPGQATTGTANE